MVRQRGPAGTQIVGSGGLTTSVQNEDKAGRWLQVMRRKRKHPEISRIRSEARGLNEGATVTGSQVSLNIPKAIDSVQLWQPSQEFDIIAERHR